MGIAKYFKWFFIFEAIFTILFFIEIGFWYSLLELFFSTLLGFFILSRFKNTAQYVSLSSFNGGFLSDLQNQNLPFFVILAGLFLIVPGIITDTFGLMLLIFNLTHIFFETSSEQQHKDKNHQHSKDDIIDI